MIDFCVVKVFIVLLEANPSLGQFLKFTKCP